MAWRTIGSLAAGIVRRSNALKRAAADEALPERVAGDAEGGAPTPPAYAREECPRICNEKPGAAKRPEVGGVVQILPARDISANRRLPAVFPTPAPRESGSRHSAAGSLLVVNDGAHCSPSM